MKRTCHSRLTIVGPAKDLARLEAQSDWLPEADMPGAELMRRSPRRHIWQFDSAIPPYHFIVKIAKEWERITFLLDYDWENKRVKGIAMAFRDRSLHHVINYENRNRK